MTDYLVEFWRLRASMAKSMAFVGLVSSAQFV